MKILGIVAGRHNGNSEILVKEALLACQEAGAECKLINLFDYNINQKSPESIDSGDFLSQFATFSGA